VNRAVLVRYTGQKDATLARWLERMGEHSQGLHNRLFRGLVLSLVQLDELYAQVKDSEQAVNNGGRSIENTGKESPLNIAYNVPSGIHIAGGTDAQSGGLYRD
jgi:hypothetical protein